MNLFIILLLVSVAESFASQKWTREDNFQQLIIGSKRKREVLFNLLNKRKSDTDDEDESSNQVKVLHWISSQTPEDDHDTTLNSNASPIPIQENIEVYSQKRDISFVKCFQFTMNRIFTELLSYVEESGGNYVNFIRDKVHLEKEMYNLGVEFAKMTVAGNLFRSRVSRPFHVTRSLFQLLQYRNALELRFSNDPSNGSKTNQGSERVNIEHYGLKLVKFEISLFGLFRQEVILDTKASDFSTRVQKAFKSFETLLTEFKETVPSKEPLHVIYANENARIKDLLRSLGSMKKAPPVSSIATASKVPDSNFPAFEKSDMDKLSNQPTGLVNVLQPVLDQFEREFQSIRSTLAQCYQDGNVQIQQYKTVKTSMERLQVYLKQPSLPEEAKIKVKEFLVEVSPAVDRLVDFISGKKTPGPSLEQPIQSKSSKNLSCESLMTEIKNIETYVNDLSLKHLEINYLGRNIDHEQLLSEIDAQKSRKNAIQAAIEFAECINVEELSLLLSTMDRVDYKIDVFKETLLKTFIPEGQRDDLELRGAYGPPVPSAPELEIIDSTENSDVEPFDIQLQEFEVSLVAFSAPTNKGLGDIRMRLHFQKLEFQNFLQNSKTEQIPQTEIRKFRVAQIKQKFEFLEGFFK